MITRRRAQLLDFLGGLPEKQIRADSRAEHGDHGGQVGRAQLDARPNRRASDFGPGDRENQRHCHISEQDHRGPFEQPCVSFVRNQYLKHDRKDAEYHHIELLWSGQEKVDRRPHRRKVRRDIDHVGDRKERDGAIKQPDRVAGSNVRRQPLPGDAPDTCTHQLDRRHERVGQQQGPEQIEAELGARLRIGSDAGWIVISRPGRQPRTEAA